MATVFPWTKISCISYESDNVYEINSFVLLIPSFAHLCHPVPLFWILCMFLLVLLQICDIIRLLTSVLLATPFSAPWHLPTHTWSLNTNQFCHLIRYSHDVSFILSLDSMMKHPLPASTYSVQSWCRPQVWKSVWQDHYVCIYIYLYFLNFTNTKYIKYAMFRGLLILHVKLKTNMLLTCGPRCVQLSAVPGSARLLPW